MAQTGYTPILIYSSSTASNLPNAANLTNSTLGSELAINITDGKLFYKDNANAVQVIGWKTTPTTAGGTGLTSYTAGDLLYYATGTTLAKLGIGSANQILKSTGSAPAWENVSALAVTSISFGSTGLTPSTATQGAVTVAGTLAVGNGGTGLTTLTAGYIPYGNATSAFQSSTNLKFDGTTLAVGGTQSAWSGVGNVVQTPGASIWGSSAVAHYSRNAYFDGSNYKYIANGYAEDYYQLAGAQVWRTAASGSAGGTISAWTNQLYLHPSAGVSIGNTTDPGATNLSVTGNVSTSASLKSTLAVGSGANIDTSGQTALTLTASSNALLVAGAGYYLVIISEVTQTGQSGVYMLTNGSASLVTNSTLAGTSYWVASTTTPSNLQFSIAYSGGNYRLYNGCTTAGTYTYKANVIKIS
jgi:hypothetical protein